MTDSAIHTLCRALEAELSRDEAGANVPDLLGEYARAHDDWQHYRHFCEHFYARNLVEVNDLFELIVICWKAGQTSPIHNHAGQHCWMAVVEGTIEETHYRAPVKGAREPLEPLSVQTFPVGSVGYIDDSIALHGIRPAADRPAVSLHLYSRPILTCNIYDPETGEVRPKRVGYYTVEGRLVG